MNLDQYLMIPERYSCIVCGIPVFIDRDVANSIVTTGRVFYCLNGHDLYLSKIRKPKDLESEITSLKSEITSLKEVLATRDHEQI
jgi:hypothetical protein